MNRELRANASRPPIPWAAVLLVSLLISGCHAKLPPLANASVTTSDGRTASRPIATLQRDLDAVLAEPALARSYWGVLIRSLAKDDTLYALNPGRLLMPGSAMKVVTLAAAADTLGWDFTYETRLVAVGAVDAGVLDGDLVVVGSGDPSLLDRDGTAAHVFDDWAKALKSSGILAITGRIIGDDNAFDDEALGPGWAWDDVAEGFAAGVGALQFNENAVRVLVEPGETIGSPAIVRLTPSDSGLSIVNALKTTAAGTPASIQARRSPGSTRLDLRGSVPLGSAGLGRTVSVDNPTLFFVTTFRNALRAAGIDVRGTAVDVDDLAAAPPIQGGRTIASYRSAPLSTLAVTMMKNSQNLYAETLLKTVGASVDTPTTEGSRAALMQVLTRWGIAAPSVVQVDGSGLSRYNYVTPDALVTILTHVARDERLDTPFEASLPIAGRDGTLATRLRGATTEGRVRAKTGTLANARALAGYMTTADGEPLVFSIIGNNYGTTPDVAIAAIDAIVTRVAAFRR